MYRTHMEMVAHGVYSLHAAKCGNWFIAAIWCVFFFHLCRWMSQRRTEYTIPDHWCLLEWTWMRSLGSMSDRSNKRYEEPVLTRGRESITARETSQRHCCILPGTSGLIAKKFGSCWTVLWAITKSKEKCWISLIFPPFKRKGFVLPETLHSWWGFGTQEIAAKEKNLFHVEIYRPVVA